MPLRLSLSPDELNCFQHDYAAARAKLKILAEQQPWTDHTETFPLATTKHNESAELATELFWVGPATAENIVVLISATHGIEGYAGAAIQADFLIRQQRQNLLPDNTAVIIIFALNPYGFSCSRRCDENGIDLNRNFIDFSASLPINKNYRLLQNIIFTHDAAQRSQQFNQLRQQWGQSAFEVAISGGQYHDPSGPFYGGTKASHGRQVIEHIIERYQLKQKHLAVIDIHTGLGAYAHGEVINDHPLNSRGYATARQWYGASVTAPAAGDSCSVLKQGLLDYAWHPLMQKRGCFVTLEFGTYSTDNLFAVVIDNHLSWRSAKREAIEKSTEAMKAHFSPSDINWQELVLVKARQTIQQAFDGLNYV
ncbi:MAG: M14 family metallopeptidase [Gammaproteobacteria bacterium]|nr:M14 family metallopeptidase [Gammaproteobacteria bacterium]